MTRNIRSHADLELSTALTHAPRSLVWGQELQHPAGPRPCDCDSASAGAYLEADLQVRVPREGGDPVLLSKKGRKARQLPPTFAGDTAERAEDLPDQPSS